MPVRGKIKTQNQAKTKRGAARQTAALEKDPQYDVFLSHASEDTDWCVTLAERLRYEGVRVWFDQWELKAGDHLLARLR